MVFPKDHRHGTLDEVPRRIAERLLSQGRNLALGSPRN